MTLWRIAIAVPEAYGRFTVQQAAKNKAIQWGAYPSGTYSGTQYLVNVYAGGVKIDAKNQSYAPHGSVGADRAAKYTGKILQVSGTVKQSAKTVLVFNMQCRIM